MEFTGEEGGRLQAIMRLADERYAPSVSIRCIARSLKETLKLTGELGDPWEQGLSSWAMTLDQSDIVKWLVENGCPRSDWAM